MRDEVQWFGENTLLERRTQSGARAVHPVLEPTVGQCWTRLEDKDRVHPVGRRSPKTQTLLRASFKGVEPPTIVCSMRSHKVQPQPVRAKPQDDGGDNP